MRPLFAALALVFAAGPLGAQQPDALQRLPAGAQAEVRRLVDSARALGLPAEPLVSKALEGATKGAPPERIVAVVRRLSTALLEARTALGTGSSQTEMIAGAAALQAGVQTDALARLRTARQGSLTTSLVVLADLVARRVPPETAATAVLRLAEAGATDEQFATLRRDVEHDIGAGAAPAVAAITRASGFDAGPRGSARPPRAPEANP